MHICFLNLVIHQLEDNGTASIFCFGKCNLQNATHINLDYLFYVCPNPNVSLSLMSSPCQFVTIDALLMIRDKLNFVNLVYALVVA